MAYAPRPDRFEVPDFRNVANYWPAQTLPKWTDWLPYWRFWKSIANKGFDFDFLTSYADFQTEKEDAWQPSRFLGAGSYGVVGSWVKKDKTGKTVDEIAIKEIQRQKIKDKYPKERYPEVIREQSWDPSRSEALLREAVIQKQLNLDQTESM